MIYYKHKARVLVDSTTELKMKMLNVKKFENNQVSIQVSKRNLNILINDEVMAVMPKGNGGFFQVEQENHNRALEVFNAFESDKDVENYLELCSLRRLCIDEENAFEVEQKINSLKSSTNDKFEKCFVNSAY